MSKHLLEPVEIGGIKLHNRIVLAPMTRTRAAADGTPTDLMAEYYAQRASAGLVIAEATGSLAKERAMVRLVSLSCLDQEGHAVIDQGVKGFVVDRDGKVGLGGRVVL